MYSLPLLSRSTGMEGDRSFSSASNSTSTEDNEYVWDGFTHGDQLVATNSANDDYYEDLELAARLGKTLLQKNKELDTINYQLRCCNEEQGLEIEHMNKQLTWLREVNESKTRMFEQLDVNYQELESTNQKLRNESREWKERMTKCMSVCDNQEEQIQSLKAEMESIRKLHEGKKAREKMRRRTIHGCLPTAQQDEIDLQKFLETSAEFSSSFDPPKVREKSTSDEEMAALHEVIGNLRAQQVMDKRMVKEMRREMEAVIQENQDACEKLREEREMTQRLNHIIEEYDKVVYRQAFVAESTPNITAEFTNNEIDFSDDSSEDDESSEQQEAEPTSTIGLDLKSPFQSPRIHAKTPITQYLRICNSTPMKSPSPGKSPQNISAVPQAVKSKPHNRPPKNEPKNVSLVQELDSQYKSLLGKYEMLLHSIESERAGSPAKECPAKESRPNSSMDGTGDNSSSFLTHSVESDMVVNFSSSRLDQGHLSRGTSVDSVPEYKRLFREIFSMINEAKNDNL